MDRSSAPERPRATLVVVPRVDWGQLTEKELLEACLSGSSSARRELWERYDGSVRRLLRRRLSEDIDDQAQETWLRVFTNLHKLREPAALHGFILGVAFRVRQGEVRRLVRFRGLFTREPNDFAEQHELLAAPNGEEMAIARAFWTALERIGDDTRILFVLRHVEELEISQIAEVLHVSESTAKRKLRRAMLHVNALLEENPSLRSVIVARVAAGTSP